MAHIMHAGVVAGDTPHQRGAAQLHAAVRRKQRRAAGHGHAALPLHGERRGLRWVDVRCQEQRG